MEAMGRDNLTLANLYALLSVPPVLASDTVYTSVSDPKEGYYQATVRTHDEIDSTL